MLFVLLTVLVATFATTSSVYAAGCGSSVTVVKGDTLRKIADRCGTTVSALSRANPEIGNGNLIFPGQVLQLPGTILGTDGGYFIYIVARGDTLKKLATRFDTTVDALLKANPEIKNQNLIYEGQHLKVYVGSTPPPTSPPPASGQVYYVKKGDTLRSIASRLSTTVEEILKVEPEDHEPEPDLCRAGDHHPGQRLLLHCPEGRYAPHHRQKVRDDRGHTPVCSTRTSRTPT
jgi:LysM repeat protein